MAEVKSSDKPYISIHALRGEGDRTLWKFKTFRLSISIHALRGEGDVKHTVRRGDSTISIHALRGEGDLESSLNTNGDTDFNPRPPWGGRQTQSM